MSEPNAARCFAGHVGRTRFTDLPREVVERTKTFILDSPGVGSSAASIFTAPTWRRVLVRLLGVVLSPGRRTVAADFSVTGLNQDPHSTKCYRVLNRS